MASLMSLARTVHKVWLVVCFCNVGLKRLECMWLCPCCRVRDQSWVYRDGRSENTEREKIKSEVFRSSERVSHTGQRNRGVRAYVRVCVCVCVCVCV